jgi:hypothetical protein
MRMSQPGPRGQANAAPWRRWLLPLAGTARRDLGGLPGSDEREQTLNQLPAGTSPPDADARAAARCLPHCQNNLPAG